MDGKATKADASLRIAQRLLWARSGHTGFPEAAVATNVRSQVACPAQVGQELPVTYVWWTDCFKQTTDIVPPN